MTRRERKRQRQRAAVLRAIHRGVRYGYDLTRVVRVSSGRLYPILDELEEDRLIERVQVLGHRVSYLPVEETPRGD